MKSALVLAVALLAAPAAHADFIARALPGDGSIVTLTNVLCDKEPGYKALQARGNWMQRGCYTQQDGTVLIHWLDRTTGGKFERVPAERFERTSHFREWPKNQPEWFF